MAKIFLLILFHVFSASLFSQARIGSSVTEIKNEFWERKYNLTPEYDEYGDYFITIETSLATVFYYFDSDNICNTTLIVPNDEGILNYYVELYNKQYVILSPTKWKMYNNYGYYEIELCFLDDGISFFMWK